jgi:tellurite resistance protein TerC
MRIVLWAAFAALVLGFLALDLGVLHRRARQVSLREAFGWSAFWIVLALAFGGVLFFWRGIEIALQFLTGYLIEKALSIDILFVFMLILGYFQVPPKFQHTVLFWGIVGALVMRLILIALGLSMIATFHWALYAFGAFLVLTGFRLLFQGDRPVQPERNLFVRGMRRVLPVSREYAGTRFVTRRDGRLMATPLLPALVAVESTDLVFALDSIPAVLAVTREPLVVYSANVFALLGMRALYFALSGIMPFFHYLRYAFAAILVLAGTRMLLAEWYEVPVTAVLSAVVALLLVTMVASVVRPRASQIEALLAQGGRTGEFQPEQVKLVERVFEMTWICPPASGHPCWCPSTPPRSRFWRGSETRERTRRSSSTSTAP